MLKSHSEKGTRDMCRSTGEPGGPKRCSGDTRTTYSRAAQDVDRLERQVQALSRTPRRIDKSLHAALRAAVLDKTDVDPDELDREVAAAIAADTRAEGPAAPPAIPQSRNINEPPQRRAACFFCDTVIATDGAAHMTRHGKICCQECWPDIRLTQSAGGGL